MSEEQLSQELEPLIQMAAELLEEASGVLSVREMQEAKDALAYVYRAAMERAPHLLQYPELWDDYQQSMKAVVADLAADVETAFLAGLRKAKWEKIGGWLLAGAEQLLKRALPSLEAWAVRLVQQALQK